MTGSAVAGGAVSDDLGRSPGGGPGRLPSDGADDASRVLPEGDRPPAGVPAGLFAAAVDCFEAGRRLDMQALSRALGVGRATVYRKVGTREQLLDEVIWWRTRRFLSTQLDRTAELRGVPRLVEVIAAVFRAVQRDPAVRAFLTVDRDAALRVMTGDHGRLQTGLATTLTNLVDLETARGTFSTDLDTPTLVYAVMRISESFLYSDRLADNAPDADRARTVVEALLRGLDTSGPAQRTAVSATASEALSEPSSASRSAVGLPAAAV